MGVTVELDSEWQSPLALDSKPDGSMRFCTALK